MEISNLFRLTPRRVLLLLVLVAIGGGVGAAVGRNQSVSYIGSSNIVVSSLVGIDQPDYLAQSFTKAISDLVTLDSTSARAARDVGIDASDAVIESVASDGGTKVSITATLASDKADKFAVALGREALVDSSRIQIPLATTARDKAAQTQQDAVKTLAGFDLQHGTDIADDANLPQADRDARRDLRAQREVMTRAVDSAQKDLDDASSRLNQAQVFDTMSTQPSVIVSGGRQQESRSSQLLKTAGGGAAAGLAIGLLLIILSERRSRRSVTEPEVSIVDDEPAESAQPVSAA